MATTTTINKTAATSLLTLQNLAAGAVVISAVQNVASKLAALVCIHFGRTSNTALTEGVEIRVEGSSKASADGHWYPLAVFKTKLAAITSQAVNGACASGQTTIPEAATAGNALYDIVYVKNTSIANGEFHRVKKITTNTSIDVEDNLVNTQTGSTVYPSAEMFTALLDLTSVTRLRLVVSAANSGQAIDVEADMVSGDSLNNA